MFAVNNCSMAHQSSIKMAPKNALKKYGLTTVKQKRQLHALNRYYRLQNWKNKDRMPSYPYFASYLVTTLSPLYADFSYCGDCFHHWDT